MNGSCTFCIFKFRRNIVSSFSAIHTITVLRTLLHCSSVWLSSSYYCLLKSFWNERHFSRNLLLITATLSWYRRCSLTCFFFESKPLNPAGCSLLSATNARLNKMTRELPNLSPPREHPFSCSTRQSPEAPWWHSATGLLSKRPRHLCTTPQLHLVGEGGRRP